MLSVILHGIQSMCEVGRVCLTCLSFGSSTTIVWHIDTTRMSIIVVGTLHHGTGNELLVVLLMVPILFVLLWSKTTILALFTDWDQINSSGGNVFLFATHAVIASISLGLSSLNLN